MELFAKPGVGGIIEKTADGVHYILMQDRVKEDAKSEMGLLEIPAGKVREFENIFDCLRREIWEETGLTVTSIEGEESAVITECNGYKVIHYQPFACSQNLQGTYPIMVQTFLCKAEGELLPETNETKNIRWISLQELSQLLQDKKEIFYPMHIDTLRKYVRMKENLTRTEIELEKGF